MTVSLDAIKRAKLLLYTIEPKQILITYFSFNNLKSYDKISGFKINKISYTIIISNCFN